MSISLYLYIPIYIYTHFFFRSLELWSSGHHNGSEDPGLKQKAACRNESEGGCREGAESRKKSVSPLCGQEEPSPSQKVSSQLLALPKLICMFTVYRGCRRCPQPLTLRHLLGQTLRALHPRKKTSSESRLGISCRKLQALSAFCTFSCVCCFYIRMMYILFGIHMLVF